MTNVATWRGRLARVAVALGLAGVGLMQPVVAAAAPVSQPAKVWGFTVPGQFQRSSPKLGYINGMPTVSVGNLNGNLYTVSARDGAAMPGWPQNTGHGVQSSPSAVDVTGDGATEVFVGTGEALDTNSPGAALGYNSNGTLRYRIAPWDAHANSHAVFSSPAVGDVNGDGVPDVSAFSLGLQGWSTTDQGVTNPGWPFYQDDTTFSSPALADLDGDGVAEYVVGGDSTPGPPIDHRGGMVRALRGDGTLMWQFLTDEIVESSPAVGDIDGDGVVEIVTATGSFYARNGGSVDHRFLFVLRPDGSLKWKRDLGEVTVSSPTLADINGDGKLDIVIGTFGTGKLWVFDGNGTALPGWGGKASYGGVVVGQITTAQLDNQGGQDLLVPTGAGLVAYSSSGTQLFTVNIGQISYQNSPAVADVDGDGRLDIFLAGFRSDGTGLFERWEMPDTTARLGALGWHMWRKDGRNTGSWQDTPLRFVYNGPNEVRLPANMSPGQMQWSADRRFRLVMQTDGNIVVYQGNQPRWHSNTGLAGSFLRAQSDGNLVMYDPSGQPRWYTGTNAPGGSIVLQNDGNLVVYTAARQPLWDAYGYLGRRPIRIDTRVGSLSPGQTVSSLNGQFLLRMQTDGNVVSYTRDFRPLWDSGTFGYPNAHLTMQSDGNVVIYSGARPLWYTNSFGTNPIFVHQDDGNTVVYASGRAQWDGMGYLGRKAVRLI